MGSENERLTIFLTREDTGLLLSLGKKHKFTRQKKGKKEVNISKTISFVLQQYPLSLQKIRDLENNGFENKDTSLNGGNALSQPTTENPFDYEKWYPDCEYGTYFKPKKKVHCACSYPSISKWLPKDRLVDPQVCDTCLPRVQGIKEFIKKREEEKQALAHTGKYFTNEFGQKIPY